MSGRQVKAQRRAAGLTPEVERGHRAFLREMRVQQAAWESDGAPLRSRRVRRAVLGGLLAVVALVSVLAWVGA